MAVVYNTMNTQDNECGLEQPVRTEGEPKFPTQGAYYLNRQVILDRTKVNGNKEVFYCYEFHGEKEVKDGLLIKLKQWMNDPTNFTPLRTVLSDSFKGEFKYITDMAQKVTDAASLGDWEISVKVKYVKDRQENWNPEYWIQARMRLSLEELAKIDRKLEARLAHTQLVLFEDDKNVLDFLSKDSQRFPGFSAAGNK